MRRILGVLAAICSLVSSSPQAAPAATTLALPTPPSRPLAVSIRNYPRLASIYALRSPVQVPTMARYGLLIAPSVAGTSGAVSAIKSVDPSARLILYDNTTTVNMAGFDGMTIYPGWWLTLVGTRLAAPIDATTTTIPVVNVAPIRRFLATDPDVLVDGETMHVLAIDAAHRTLIVRRGYYSTAAPHDGGARIAAHASKWPHTWMLNVTPYCPVDPATGQTWVEYAAQQARKQLAEAPWDGILWDDGNVSFARLYAGQLDADNDNVADGGEGPSGAGWQQGVQRLLARTRALAPGKLQLVTDAYYPGLMDGQQMEHFPYYANGWMDAFTTYLQMATPEGTAPYSVINADSANRAATNFSGPQDLRTMRFTLATALMGDGYFAYDSGPQNHGQTWWYDEYDDGAGSSLATAIGASQTRITLAPGTGQRFKVGDIVHVPDGRDGHDDEQMRVTAVHGDMLGVERGSGGSAPAPHPARTKVVTEQQLLAGLGWLGQPLGPARPLALTSPNMLVNGSFDRPTPAGSAPWTLSVRSPAAATIQRESRQSGDGQSAARIQVTAAAPNHPWYVAFTQQNAPGGDTLHLVAGAVYTLSFWAKSSANQIVQAQVQQSAAPWSVRGFEEYQLANHWQRYSLTFTAPVSESAIKVVFTFARTTGTVWLNAVRFQQGDSNLWRRDFTHGTVLLNATGTVQAVWLGPGYRRIDGTQDPRTNNGKPAPTVTLDPHDALLLVKTS